MSEERNHTAQTGQQRGGGIHGVRPEAGRQLLGLLVIMQHAVTVLELVGCPRLRSGRLCILLCIAWRLQGEGRPARRPCQGWVQPSS